MRDNGTGYPEDEDHTKVSRDQLLSSSVVGDGGASWRLKALKRAQEQAAREGRNVKEVCFSPLSLRIMLMFRPKFIVTLNYAT